MSWRLNNSKKSFSIIDMIQSHLMAIYHNLSNSEEMFNVVYFSEIYLIWTLNT